MAELTIDLEDNLYKVTSQGFYWEFPAVSPENQKAVILFLRGFKAHPQAKQGLFTQEQIARAMPDFAGASRQSIRDHQRRFEESGGDLKRCFTRKRKVNEEVVEAVTQQLQQDPLATNARLTEQVKEQLGREDLTSANIEAALEQISAHHLRKVVQTQLDHGTLHYQEEYLLEQVFEALQSDSLKESSRALTLLERAGIGEPRETGTKLLAPRQQEIEALLTPGTSLWEISWELKWAVVLLVLYGHGLPLRVLGSWLGVDKTTVLRWILGLSQALWSQLSEWITPRVRGTTVYLDEKWVKIKGKWQYWFVALDGETELPIVQELMKKRTRWNCLQMVVKLKRLRFQVKIFVTDGLKGYGWAIARVYKEAVHQLCLFHQQQNVSKFAREHFSDEHVRQERKKEMKKVFQTNDKRTVKNRLATLREKAEEWGIGAWLQRVWEELPHLLPAIGSRKIPKTTNAIERFFRAFNRFYKVRKGFHSLKSAKGQLTLFLVFWVFTQKEDGRAPIERIMPEARTMPLYQLMNDPFRALGLGSENVKRHGDIAQDRLKEAA